MKKILFNLLSLIFISSCTVSTPVTPTSTPVVAPTSRADWKTYKSPNLPVTVQYPSDMHYHDKEEFRGEGTFFYLTSVYAQGVSLNGVCAGEANQLEFWYGRNSTLERVAVSGYEACLLTPSDDQDFMMKGQSAVIVHLPLPRQLQTGKANYIFLIGSEKFIRGMMATMVISP